MCHPTSIEVKVDKGSDFTSMTGKAIIHVACTECGQWIDARVEPPKEPSIIGGSPLVDDDHFRRFSKFFDVSEDQSHYEGEF